MDWQRERLLLGTALAGVVLAAAIATVLGAGMEMSALEMTRMGKAPGLSALGLGEAMAAMPGPRRTLPGAAAMLAMWWMMMLAMMLPSAAPMILQYSAIERIRTGGGVNARTPYVFAAGYALTWGAFSIAAVLLQWRLHEAQLLSPMMLSANRWLAAGLLFAAGFWQFSPLKSRCLSLCRSPAAFLVSHWRQGPLRMGLTHGAYCLGCCWALMLLLFYGGVMNLYWIAGLSALVLIEKLAPWGAWFARAAGIGLIAWGVAMAAAAV